MIVEFLFSFVSGEFLILVTNRESRTSQGQESSPAEINPISARTFGAKEDIGGA